MFDELCGRDTLTVVGLVLRGGGGGGDFLGGGIIVGVARAKASVYSSSSDDDGDDSGVYDTGSNGFEGVFPACARISSVTYIPSG